MTWKTLSLLAMLPAAVHSFSLLAPLAQSGPHCEQPLPRLAVLPSSVSRHSAVVFSISNTAGAKSPMFGLPAWSAISETVASALSLMRSEAQQSTRRLVRAIHTAAPMIMATRLLDTISATEARLLAALSITRDSPVVVDVGDNRVDAAVKALFRKQHYLQMLTGPRHSTLAKRYRDVNEVVVS